MFKFCVLLSGLISTVSIQAAYSQGFVSELKEISKPKLSLSTRGTRQEGMTVQLTFPKKEILSKEFLLGADLQHSTFGDPGLGIFFQAMAIGHLPVRFTLRGNVLELAVDQSIWVESDINAPRRIVHQFQILTQDENYVTVSVQSAANVFQTVWPGQGTPAGLGAIRGTWLRSAQYDPSADLLLIETTIETETGKTFEIMESYFSRSRLVSEKAPLVADPEKNTWAKRFKFLTLGDVYVPDASKPGVPQKLKTSFAMRFDSDAFPIKWYVTSNVPETFLSEIRTGIEGWNRYSKAMWDTEIVEFKGRLPDGVKVGDPRYNIVVWDSVSRAGAAYESQAADPMTGIQSHALIYLPYAWIEIGKTFWESGQLSEAGANLEDLITGLQFAGRKLPIHCVAHAEDSLTLESAANPDAFARNLLKAVLFHEVGHALGLDHNFKGSLSWDPQLKESAFSSSIMDYNQFQLDRGAFESLESSDGPLLEYDRQILSVLYGDKTHVRPSDPIVPACDDTEADALKGGVDPFCLRYDSGKDPTLQLVRALDLVTKTADTEFGASFGPMRPIGEALADLPKAMLDPTKIFVAEQIEDQLRGIARRAKGTVQFYFTVGAQSILGLTQIQTKILNVFNKDTLPENFTSGFDMRGRVFSAAQSIASWTDLPPATISALSTLRSATRAWFDSTVFGQRLEPEAREAKFNEFAAKDFDKLDSELRGKAPDSMLSVLRNRALGKLKRNVSAPFAIEAEQKIDYESRVVELLEKALTDAGRSAKERRGPADALKTFRGTAVGTQALGRIQSALQKQIEACTEPLEREELRLLLSGA